MSEPDQYEPPTTTQIAAVQNTTPALRLLLAQRQLYSRAKRWAFLRSLGISFIAVAAPIITVVAPPASVAVGAVAAVWIFVARTLFIAREHGHSSRGAEVQEQVDALIFSMPLIASRDPRVRAEDISDLVGTDEQAMTRAREERLVDWYPLDLTVDGASSIAIAQRANAAYSERLQRANANVWLLVTLLWASAAVCVGLLLHLSFAQFLLGVAIPLLPALLDVYEQWRAIRSAGAERRALADNIERHIRDEDQAISGHDLLVWQNQLYGLRRKAPQVPNLVYWRTRKKNELAMKAAAAELADIAKQRAQSRTTDGEQA